MLPALPALVLALPTQIAAPADFAKDLVALFQAEWPKNRTVDIVCHGHSVPAGYFKTPVVQTFDAYPHLLHAAIKDRYPHAVVNVIVTAIGGENSEQGAARFEADVLALRPDVVTLDYGLNDRRIGLERAKAAWTAMIQAAQARKVRVVLLTPSWDLGVKPMDSADPLFQHADQIRQLAAQFHTGLADSLEAFVKAHAAGKPFADLMSQSNHPNRAGHELILQGLLPWFGLGPPSARSVGLPAETIRADESKSTEPSA